MVSRRRIVEPHELDSCRVRRTGTSGGLNERKSEIKQNKRQK
jgi:hypothetical protein